MPDVRKRLSKSATDVYLRGLADHFFYIGALSPELFRPLWHDAVALTDTEISAFRFTFTTWLYLMQGAPDKCTDRVLSELRRSPSSIERLYILAAILTPRSLQALADFAREQNVVSQCEDLGFAIDKISGPAEPRFLIDRLAVQRSDDLKDKHTVGDDTLVVSKDNQPEIVWHYLTLDLSDIPEASPLPFRHLHLVSPAYQCVWEMTFHVSADDRYDVIGVTGELDEAAFDFYMSVPSRVRLMPFDDSLTYSNEHILGTEGVYGEVGGPPIGCYANPKCPVCTKLMFHICTIQNYLNEYGDGFRCLYACETCRTAACTGVSWN